MAPGRSTKTVATSRECLAIWRPARLQLWPLLFIPPRFMFRRTARQLAVVSLVTIALLPFSGPMAKADLTPTGSVQVQRIIDGDTLKIDIEGTSETVRIIGIDTPETAMHTATSSIHIPC